MSTRPHVSCGELLWLAAIAVLLLLAVTLWQ